MQGNIHKTFRENNVQIFNSVNSNLEVEKKEEKLNFYKQQKIKLESKFNRLKSLYHEQYLKVPPHGDDLQNKILKLKKIYYKQDEAKNFKYDEIYLKKEDIEQINETLYLVKNTMSKMNVLFEEGTRLFFILDNLIKPGLECEFHFKVIAKDLESIIVEIERKLRELIGHVKALQSLANVADLFPELETKNSNVSAFEQRLENFLNLIQDMDFSKFHLKNIKI